MSHYSGYHIKEALLENANNVKLHKELIIDKVKTIENLKELELITFYVMNIKDVRTSAETQKKLFEAIK